MEQLTVSIDQGCKALGTCRTSMYGLINAGRVETIKLGRRRLIVAESLRKLVEEQRAANLDNRAQ